MHDTHGERDSQRLFKRFGLTLPVPISTLEVEGPPGSSSSALPYLKMSHFFEYLVRRCPQLLFGGNRRGDEAERLNRRFWDAVSSGASCVRKV